MRKKVSIGDKEFELSVNALTPIHYKRIFKDDMLRALDALRGEGSKFEGMFDFLSQTSFVAMRQAEGSASMATIDEYFSWLETFEILDIMEAGASIMDLIRTSQKQTSKPKN